MSNAPVITVEELETGYDDQPIFSGLSFTVEAGERVAITGRNGVGKSTLCRVPSALHKPMTGRVNVLGLDVAHQQPWTMAENGVIYVPQGPRLFAGMAVREHLSLAFRVGSRRSHGAGEVEALAPFLEDPSQFIHRVVDTLASGERQIVALARARAMRPRLLLLDEPSIGLSGNRVAEMAEGLTRNRWFGSATIVLIDRNPEVIRRVCDRQLELEASHLRALSLPPTDTRV